MKKRLLIITIFVVVLSLFVFSSCELPTVKTDGSSSASSSTAKSAYDIAVDNGFTGTEEDWLNSLQGATVIITEYKSIYEEAVENGFEGTFEDFVAKYVNQELINATINSTSNAINTAITSVVSVYTTFSKTVTTSGSWGRPSTSSVEEFSGAGAGVIYSVDRDNGDAYIITNFHVVYDSDDDNGYGNKFELYLYGMEYSDYKVSASLVGGSATYDIAVLKVDDSNVIKRSCATAVTFADSNNVTIGDNVVAIGNPQAKGISATTGIVSVESEEIKMTSTISSSVTVSLRVIRIDAAVNPGNSGGGLFNSYGELIGIVNAKTISSDVENMGYALPSSLVYSCVQNILANCDGSSNLKMNKCMLGVTVSINNISVYSDPLTGKITTDHEIIVTELSSNAAAEGVLKADDIINSLIVDGKTLEINRTYLLSEYLLRCSKNDVVTLNITRDGTSMNVEITLKNCDTID